MGGSRYTGLYHKEALQSHRLRLISVDRPGRGSTTPCSVKHLSITKFSWCALELMDKLGIAKFSLMADSCGALFAAVVAVCAPERVQGHLALLSPWNLPSCPVASTKLKVAHRLPGAVVSLFGSFIPYLVAKSAKAGLHGFWGRQMRKKMSSAEFATLTSPCGRELMKQTTALLMAEGGKQAMINDMLLSLETYGPSDVHYTAVTMPVIVYHGDDDKLVPLKCAVWMRDNMSCCELVVKAGGTHNLLLDRSFMAGVVLPKLQSDWENQACTNA
ncbi:hypothetical protein WJX72_004765 [[Myrmecia] bisecta]|uniref:AB hydrolase-1 domain-containing protein n=1 Tax=[Myrmecia] bisecta TaxID=41462 RepID=A0AAW1Q3V0_9CHLO